MHETKKNKERCENCTSTAVENSCRITVWILQENYPHVAPIWFSECDDSTVTAILQSLTEAEAPCYILPQTHELVSRLCSYYNVTIPTELISIGPVCFSFFSSIISLEILKIFNCVHLVCTFLPGMCVWNLSENPFFKRLKNWMEFFICFLTLSLNTKEMVESVCHNSWASWNTIQYFANLILQMCFYALYRLEMKEMREWRVMMITF